MAEIPVTMPDSTQGIAHVSIFDHMGREISNHGYEGGQHFLNSDILGASSLTFLATEAGLDVSSFPHVAGGSFGQRTGRGERRA